MKFSIKKIFDKRLLKHRNLPFPSRCASSSTQSFLNLKMTARSRASRYGRQMRPRLTWTPRGSKRWRRWLKHMADSGYWVERFWDSDEVVNQAYAQPQYREYDNLEYEPPARIDLRDDEVDELVAMAAALGSCHLN